MPTVAEIIESHSIHANINDVFAVLDRIDKIELPESQVYDVARIREVYIHLQVMLSYVDPSLTSVRTLDNLFGQSQSVLANLNAFLGNQHQSYLDQIRSHLNEILIFMSNLIIPYDTKDIERFSDAITSFRESLSKHVKNIEEKYENISNKNNELEVKINDLNNIVESSKGRFEQIINQAQTQMSDLQQKFSDAQEARNLTFQQQENTRSTSYNNEEIARSAKFSQEESNRRTEFENSLNKLKSDGEQVISKYSSRFEDLYNTTKSDINMLFDYLDDKKSEVERQVGSIAITTMAGAYKQAADKERNTTYLWQGITVVAFICLICSAIWFVDLIKGSPTSWQLFTSRFILIAAVTSFVAFCVKQVSVHQQAEKRNRQSELELSSLNPFLTGLDEETTKTIKQSLSEKLFGRSEAAATKTDDSNSTVIPGIDINKLAELIVSKIK